jgi:hypothetical protein
VELVEPQAEPTHDHLSSLETELHKYRARNLFVTMRKFLYKISKTENDAFPWLLSVAFPPAMDFFHSCKFLILKNQKNDVKKTPNYCWKLFAICMFFACKYVNTSSLRQLFKTIQGTYLSNFIGHNFFLSTKEQAYILLGANSLKLPPQNN